MNLHDLFAIPCRRTPGKIALIADVPEAAPVELTYEELFGRARRLAAGLAARGVGKGDRVAFFLGNRPEWVVAYLAVLALGAVLVPINLAYRRREIAHMLGDAEPRLLLTEEGQLPILAELSPEERGSVEGVLAGELDRLAIDPGSWAPPVVDGDDLALLLYTSGTTGRSKGAMLSHTNVLATVTDLLAAWAWEREDVLLLALPLFHTHGLVVGLTTALAAGATVRLHTRFDAARTAAHLAALADGPSAPTLFFGVPTMYVRLVEELRRTGAGSGLRRLRLVCSGSAPLSPETFAAFQELSGHAILERYGMTETGMNLGNPYAGPRVPGQVGVPFPGVSIRIVDRGGSEGRDVPEGTEGELLVAGSNVFSGYWRAPEKTTESFLHDALGRRWFKTGDLARRDPATGAVTLLGRASELILSGGFNIYPREVEEVLATHPGVREAAVVGRPHPEWGEVPVAYLVAEGEGGRPADEDLVTYLKGQLAGFKVPRTFHYVEALPRNALGKVQKHLL